MFAFVVKGNHDAVAVAVAVDRALLGKGLLSIETGWRHVCNG